MISKNIFLTDIDEVMEFVNHVEQCSYSLLPGHHEVGHIAPPFSPVK